MDQTLVLKTAEFKKALKGLSEALAEKKTDIVRDSVIKRFEYTYELAWKNSKVFLSEHFGLDFFSPKEVFRSLRSNDLLNDEETEALLAMVDDRNLIIHTYSEDFSEEIYQKIKDSYFPLFNKISEFLK